MDTIQPRRTRTAILARRTPTRRRLLQRRITHAIPAPTARLPLKHMEQAEPMPNLMRRAAPLIVVRRRPAGHGLREDVAAVLVVGAAARGSVGGEVADAEQAAAEVREEVDVQVGVGAFAEGGFHGAVVVARGPLVVGSEVGGDEGEGDARGAVGTVEDGELGCWSRVSLFKVWWIKRVRRYGRGR